MFIKIIGGCVGLALLIGFLMSPIMLIKDVSMLVVGLLGVGMAAYELYESLRRKEG